MQITQILQILGAFAAGFTGTVLYLLVYRQWIETKEKKKQIKTKDLTAGTRT